MRDNNLDEKTKLEESFPVWLGLHKELPTNTEFLNRLGEIYAARGDYSRALWMFEEAVIIDPLYQLAFINMAKTYFATGNHQKAELYFEKAGDIDAYSADICRVFGEFLAMQKQYDKALQWFQTVSLSIVSAFSLTAPHNQHGLLFFRVSLTIHQRRHSFSSLWKKRSVGNRHLLTVISSSFFSEKTAIKSTGDNEYIGFDDT